MTAPTVTVFEAADLTACLNRILTAILDTAAVLPDVVDLPTRQITNTAGTTWDCPMVYVSGLTVQRGLPDPSAVDIRMAGGISYPPESNLTVWTVTVEAGIVRPVSAQPQVVGPTAAAPSTDSYADDLTMSSSDAAVLLNAAQTLQIRDWQPIGQQAADVSFLESQGGFRGVATTITVEMFPGPPIPALP